MMRSVSSKLRDKAVFPVEISLHGVLGIIGAFIRAAIAVDGRRSQTTLTGLQLETRAFPGARPPFQNEDIRLCQFGKFRSGKPGEEACAAGKDPVRGGRKLAYRIPQIGPDRKPRAGNVPAT